MVANLVFERLIRSQALYRDFVAGLSIASLNSRLSNLPSNTIGQQLWCVIGARESYVKAIRAGQWQGFTCSLLWEKTSDKEAVSGAVAQSGDVLAEVVASVLFDEVRAQLMMDLLEHEIQHQGQLIRYAYGLNLGLPESWKQRYHLD